MGATSFSDGSGPFLSHTTRCKFKCMSVEKYSGLDEQGIPINGASEPSESIRLDAVYDPGSPENEIWSKYTPSGSFQMHVTNPNVFGRFTVGKSYLLDISEAE